MTSHRFVVDTFLRSEYSTVLQIAQVLEISLDAAQPSTPVLTPQDYVSGYRAGWKDGWDAAVSMVRGGASGATPSPR